MYLKSFTQKNFELHIEKFYKKFLKKNKSFQEDYHGISAVDIFYDQNKIARILNKLIKNGQYSFDPPIEKNIYTGKKKRHIFSYSTLDNLVQSVLYEHLSACSNKFIFPNVYSYIKGKSSYQAVAHFLKYIRKVRKNNKIDVFVLRGDIFEYTDSIPIGKSSFVWKIFEQLLVHLPEQEKKYFLKLITHLLRPELKTSDGFEYQKIIGIPTGNSISTLVANLYLLELDHYFSQIPDSFYARYGDDFFFAHTNLQHFLQAKQEMLNVIKKLELRLNESKNHCFYFTKAGKKLHFEGDKVDEIIGTNKINFLGYQIYAEGSYSPSCVVFKKIIRNITARVKNTNAIFSHLDSSERGKILCQSVNNMFNLEHSFCMPEVKILLNKVTNRGYLKNLDYEIALTISEAVSGEKGVRSWRKISYQTVRQQWGLISLCQLKNNYNLIKQ